MALSLQRYTSSDFSGGLNRILKERSENERERSMAIAIKMGDHLPESLTIEILSWLPVKTLLLFKSVCKSWYDIITSPNFISKHLENYYNLSDHDCLLAQYYVTHSELQVFELLVDETSRALSYEVLYHMPLCGSYVCGPCDGLYYLYHYDYAYRALWNPAINEIKVLPPIITKPNLPSNVTYSKHEIYGFGLDPVTKDYKVIVIKRYRSTSAEESKVRHPLSVLLYSLRTDSWRYWGDLEEDYHLDNNKCYIFANGVFYWSGSFSQYEFSEVIVSFDMANDAIGKIQVPDYSKPASKSLAIYHDSIALLTVHEIDKCLDIWTLNEGFWTKKFTMGLLSQVRNPLGHWKNSKFLLECDDNKLVLCDPDTQDMRDLVFDQTNRWSEGIFAYMESLVSVKDRNELGRHEEAETDADQV